MYDQNAIKIYTDGSCKPNPGKGGIGLIIEFPEKNNCEEIEISEGYFQSTNQRMELTACIVAIKWLVDNGKTFNTTRAIIITDSDYVYSNYDNAKYWKSYGWINQDGKPYENKDLWDSFLKERAKLHFNNEIKWEKGKTRPILDRVDKLAKDGADNPTRKDFGFQPGKFTSSRSSDKKAATMFPANGEELLVRIFVKKIAHGKNENELYKITFDIFDNDNKEYSKKFFAYTDKDKMVFERNHCYKVKMNNNPKFPKIIKVESIDYLK